MHLLEIAIAVGLVVLMAVPIFSTHHLGSFEIIAEVFSLIISLAR